MKSTNPNIRVIENSIDEAIRYIKTAERAKLRLIENDNSEYTQYSFKEIGAIKRAALDLKANLTTITKMKS